MARLKVLLNAPRPEVVREGFRAFRYATSIQTGSPVLDTDTEGGKSGIQGWKPVDDPNLWRNPATGAFIVRPSGLRDDFFESPNYADGKFQTSHWRYIPADWLTIPYEAYPGQSGSITAYTPQLPSELAELSQISCGTHMDNWITQAGTALRWQFELNYALPVNASWGVIVQPHGTALYKSISLLAVGFGIRFVIDLNSNGIAKLWMRFGNEWSNIDSFDYVQGGVDSKRAFSLNVIPGGIGGITFLFSQATTKTKTARGTAGSAPRKDVAFYVDVRKYDPSITFDQNRGTWNAVPQGVLCIATRKRLSKVNFAPYRNIFPTTLVTTKLMPENLLDLKEQGGLTVVPFGIDSIAPFPDNKPWMDTNPLNTAGDGGWDVDDLICPIELKMRADVNYSPEFWGYRMFVPDQLETPEWTPIDISDKFTSLQFTSSLDLDAVPCKIKTITNNFDDLYRTYGTIKIVIDDDDENPIWEGYVTERRPVLENGEDFWISDLIDGRSIHQRLRDNQAGFDSVAGLPIRTAIERLLQQAGFALEDIEFGPDDEWMDTDNIASSEEGDQDKMWRSDTTVAEALLSIFEMYGVQDRSAITMVWQSGKWLISTAPKYDPVTPPTKRFWMGPIPHNETWITEEDRWDAEQFRITQFPEFTISPPEFNAIRVKVAKGTASDTEAAQANIIASEEVINDDTSEDFTGRIIVKTVDSPKGMAITTQAEAERFARLMVDQLSKRLVIGSFIGEWQPTVKVDDVIALIGRLPDDSPEGYKIVSFGAYRITEIDVDIRHDTETTDFSWEGTYICKYEGPAEYPEEDILMYKTEEPE
jgi:hypothetical protein